MCINNPPGDSDAKVWEPLERRFYWGNTTTPHPWPKTSPTLPGEIIHFWACGLRRDGHGTWMHIREEGEVFLASQISLINHVDQVKNKQTILTFLPMDYRHILLTEASGKITISPTSHARCPRSTLPTSHFSSLAFSYLPSASPVARNDQQFFKWPCACHRNFGNDLPSILNIILPSLYP